MTNIQMNPQLGKVLDVDASISSASAQIEGRTNHFTINSEDVQAWMISKGLNMYSPSNFETCEMPEDMLREQDFMDLEESDQAKYLSFLYRENQGLKIESAALTWPIEYNMHRVDFLYHAECDTGHLALRIRDLVEGKGFKSLLIDSMMCGEFHQKNNGVILFSLSCKTNRGPRYYDVVFYPRVQVLSIEGTGSAINHQFKMQ